MRWTLALTVVLALACGGGPENEPASVEASTGPAPADGPTELDAYGAGPDAYHPLSGTVYMGVHNGRLREAPDVDSPVVVEVPLAAEVEIIGASSDPIELIGRLHRWYQVTWTGPDGRTHKGHVFGSLLTPLAGKTFHEFHGPDLPWALTYSPELDPRLRMLIKDEEVSVDIVVTKQLDGGTWKVQPETWGDFGAMWVITQCPLAQGDCIEGHAYLGEDTKPTTSRPDRHQYAHEPIAEPDCFAAKALPFTPSDDPEPMTIRLAPQMGPDEVTCETFGTTDGKKLIDCVVVDGGKTSKSHYSVARFVEQAPDRWERLVCSSNMYENLPAYLQDRGIKVVDRDGAVLGGPFTIHEKFDPLIVVRHETEDLPTDKGDPLFEHAVFGKVYTNANGELVVPQPQGHLTLRWDPEVPGYDSVIYGCEGDIERGVILADFQGSLDPLDASAPAQAGPTEVHRLELDTLMELTKKYGGDERDLDGVDHPVLAVKDPWDRWTLVLHEELRQPNLCEPVVYLYADHPTPVDVRLHPPLKVVRTWPPTDTSWNALATPDGRPIVDGKPWDHLFWDGSSGHFPPPEHGVVIPRDRRALAELLTTLGLQDREIDEAIAAWWPDLGKGSFIEVRIHPQDTIDALAPLTVEPAEDTRIRVLVELTATDTPTRLEPPTIEVPERRGLVLVEWGVVQR